MPNAEDRLANQEASPIPPTATMLILSFVPIFLGLGFLYIVLGAWLVTVGFTAVQAGLLISVQGIAVVLTSIPLRSEERRVGKECRSRWSRDTYKKNKK